MEALREPRRTEGPPAHMAVTPAEVTAPATHDEGDGWLVCCGCGCRVAQARARIEVNLEHAHAFINPSGVIYRVGCFATAPGVLAWGEPTHYYSWFAGFAWQVAACRGCGEHLGWAYQGSGPGFVALILDRLVERPDARGAPSAS
jgi:hypothetical protein